MADMLDELGPVDWLIVQFPGSHYGNGVAAPALVDLVDRGLIRILDMLFMRRDEDGNLEADEINDLDDTQLGQLRSFEVGLAAVLSEQDVMDLAEALEPGHSAAVLVYENLWAAPFGSAIRHAGGELVASGRIPIQAVLAALEADSQVGA